MRKLHKAMKEWSNASTVILTIPGSGIVSSKEQCITPALADYNVLMLKRSAKNSFYPNTYVFPGGKIDKADVSSKWIDFYYSIDKEFVKLFDNLKIHQPDGDRSPMFLDNGFENLLPSEVSFRICALRETFEETGVLVTRKNSQNLTPENFGSCGQPHEFESSDESTHWRKRVHSDANQFIQLCTHLKCVPDIWSLYEWSNWLTPSYMFTKFSKRYDTVFYSASISKLPAYSQHDDNESSEMTLETPFDLITSFKKKKIDLGPPQLYELSRLLHFTTHKELKKFAAERSVKGIRRWLPVRAATTDGVLISLYPGDRWYPDLSDIDEVNLDITYEEMLRMEPKQHNHMCFNSKSKSFHVIVCYDPPNGHIMAVSDRLDTVDNNGLSKL